MRRLIQVLCLLGLFIYYFYVYLKDYCQEKEVLVTGWEKNVSRNVEHYISSDDFHFIPKDMCRRPSLLLIIVCSSSVNTEARMAVRNTWGQTKVVQGKNISLYFLIGETRFNSSKIPLETENNKYGDIIQGKFFDTYNNLTLKSIYMLKLTMQYCFNAAKFLLKIDDDVLLNTHKLIEILKGIEETKNIIVGSLISEAKPIRNPLNKWYTPKYMFKGNIFPNYTSGTCYLMSIDVTEKLFKATLSAPIFHLEDVYVTGICAQIAGVTLLDNIYFAYNFNKSNLCGYAHLITMHSFRPPMILKYYKYLNDPKIQKKCKKHQPKFDAHKWIEHSVHTYKHNVSATR